MAIRDISIYVEQLGEIDTGEGSVGLPDEGVVRWVDDIVTHNPPTESDEVEDGSSGSSKGEEDVLGSDCDLDKNKVSDDEQAETSYPIFNPVQIFDPTFLLGMLFSTKSELKKAIQSHAIKTKRHIICTKSDPNMYYAKCGDKKCAWSLHARKMKDECTFQIRNYNPKHTCSKTFNFKNVKSSWLCDKYLDKFKSDPKRTVKGFRMDARPNGGILLTAVGVDPNNNLYPISYAVVNREARETWEWFLILLNEDLGISNQVEYVFMSDKQKGLIQAFQEVLPTAAHRFCVRHMNNNFKNTGFRGLSFKNALWKAARACTRGEFKARMKELQDLNQVAFDWFGDKPPEEWIRSHFNTNISCFDGSQYAVDLSKHSCSCRKWDLTGIPCKHANSAICNQKDDPEDYVADCYSVQTYKRVYASAIMPIGGDNMWTESCFIPPLPPNFGRRSGRPSRARRRDPDEPMMKNKKGKKELHGS
ncbi:UNVERIFIED_CONTAM: hypothetical protein Slati_3948600 [Sesamum latifolium]|uniref:SWIM-type domain-containing protein n=1 Tax=Sesamum latifolium TaxID=2727402 RepID=A0AAW2TP41_9LAMI